ncbi:MAG: hypothetical protein OEY88_09705 [Candidatus Bathyarchaeota archaeon]|nr:hypothetical protein [Candidatus Bathyarchaeota archaeon]
MRESLRRKRLVIYALLTLSLVIYTVFLVQSFRAYEEWKQVELLGYPSAVRPYVDFYPYWSSAQGKQMIVLGGIIGSGWVTATIILSPTRKVF